jgi:hypothetical protein
MIQIERMDSVPTGIPTAVIVNPEVRLGQDAFLALQPTVNAIKMGFMRVVAALVPAIRWEDSA